MTQQKMATERGPKRSHAVLLRHNRLSRGLALLKYVAIIAILAAGALGWLWASSKTAHQAELEGARAEAQQQIAKQSEELERLRAEAKEIEVLRAQSQEVVKLRGQAAQLLATQKEQQKLLAENQQLRARLQEFQQVKTENSTLQNQNQQLQGALAGRAAVGACLNNLKQIEIAKAAWALEMHKTPADVPLDADLFGLTKYLAQTPACPAGGIYTLGAVGAKPTCSAHGHAQ